MPQNDGKLILMISVILTWMPNIAFSGSVNEFEMVSRSKALHSLQIKPTAEPHGQAAALHNKSMIAPITRRIASEQGSMCTRVVNAEALPTYTWFSKLEVRQQAQVNPGNTARLRAAVDRYMKGENLTVVFLGGSITAGQGAVDGKAFPFWAEEIMTQSLGSQSKVHNGAIPGTLSSYMSVCHNMHCPKEADIVFLDYTLNDPLTISMDNPVRRPFERLIRKLLSYPRKPAVILVHAFKWFDLEELGVYWKSCERDFHDFALYYSLSELSVKAAAWHLMRKGEAGYQVDRTRGDHSGQIQPAIDASLRDKVFFWDVIHPDGRTGHKFMGEISAQVVLDAHAGLKVTPLTDQERAVVNEPLPPPMLRNNWESASDKCFIGPVFMKAILEHPQWEYKNEGLSFRPKFGYIADQPNARMKISVNTTSATGHKEKMVTVELSYLRSYVNMGQAQVECVEGCTCDPSILDGHTTDKTSLLNLLEFKVTQHDRCIISITVLKETSSGKHKVKIAGIMISEEGGGEGVHNHMAIDMLMEGVSSNVSKATAFDINAWAKSTGRRLNGLDSFYEELSYDVPGPGPAHE